MVDSKSMEITKQAIWKLAHFEPSSTDDYGNQVLDYLILDALATFGPLLSVVPSQIQEHIKKVFLLDFDQAEIVTAGRRMAPKDYLILNEPDKKINPPAFSISPELHEKISRNLNSIRNEEEQILSEWKIELVDSYKSHSEVQKNIDTIVYGLQNFLSAIFIRHGVECVNLLYPDNPKAASWLESVKDEVFESIPKTNEFIDTIIRLEVPKFFLKPDERRKQYVFRIFNSSFLWHLVQVDENCSQLFREVTAGQRIYLDNNVLYSLVGFNGAYVLQSTNNLLRLAKELGYELLVTTKTIEEFHESLQWQLKEYKMKPPIPAELATIAVKNLGAESFITVYWKELAETGITIEEFTSEKSHLDDIFNGLGITPSDEYRVEIEESKELQIEINILREVAPPWTNNLVLEHDAFHRILIQKIRDGKKYNFKDAVAWFLTADSKLPVYDRVARRGNNCLPFCLTTDHWIQLNRPLITRTANRDEYEKSFYTLVTQPFLRSMMPQAEMEKAHQDVLSRLSRYKAMNQQLAFDIVANTQFMLSIASEEKPEKIDEKLEHEFLDVAIEYQRKTETLEVDNANFQMEAQEQFTSLQREIVEQAETLNMVRSDLGNLEREKREIENEKEKLKKKSALLATIIKWITFSALLIPTSYLIWSSNISIKWIADGKGIILAKLLIQLIITGLLLLIPLWKYKKWLIGSVILGLVSIGLTLLPDILK